MVSGSDEQPTLAPKSARLHETAASMHALSPGQRQSLPPMDRPAGLLARIGGGVAMLGCATWIAVEGLPQWEERLFEALNGGPAGLELVLWLPMQFGSLFGPFAVGGALWWRSRQWRPALGSVVVGVLAWQVAKVLKAEVERGRPFALLNKFARRAGTPYEGLGFVSGHSAVAFAVASVVAPYLSRPQRILAWAMALLVGLARIQVSAHLPLDVVGGASLGVAVGNTWNVAVGVPPRGTPGPD